MKLSRLLLIAFLCLLSVCLVSRPSAAQSGSSWTLESAISMMDKAAQDFHSLSADIEHIKYTKVVDDKSVETGQIFVRRDDKMLIDFQKPDPRTILRTGDSIFVYTPKIHRVEEFNLGKHRAFADQYLALGFGTKGEALKKNYVLTLIGEEDFDSRKTIVLELTPKSEQARAQISRIRMWIDEASWLPIQQKFFETSTEDYFLSHYTHLMKNLKLPDSKFKADWPKDVKIEKPRG